MCRRSQARNLWSHRWGASSAHRVERLEDPPAADRRRDVRRGPRPSRCGVADLRALAARPRARSRRSTRRPPRRHRACSASSPPTTSPSWDPSLTPIRPTPRRCAARSSPSGRCATSASRSWRSSPRTARCGADAADLVVVDYEPLAVRRRRRSRRHGRSRAVPRARLQRRDALRLAIRGRLQRVRGGRRRTDRQPAADGSAHRGAFRRRNVDRRRAARPLLGVPGRPSDEGVARRAVPARPMHRCA